MKYVLLFCLALLAVVSAKPKRELSYDEKYLYGVNAYGKDKWQKSIEYFSLSDSEWWSVESSRGSCYSGCLSSPSGEVDYYQWLFSTSVCVSSCLTPNPLTSSLYSSLRTRKALNYLQMALHKDGRDSEAAQVFAQYSYYNPQDKSSKVNFHYYGGMDSVSEEDLKPKITLPYREHYIIGDEHFYAGNWSGMVESFESSLLSLYGALAECRSSCHGPTQLRPPLNLPQTISALHLKVVTCQSQCPKKLGMFRNNKEEKFLMSIFNYLQYGYYHLNQTDEATQAVAAQLRVEPENQNSQKTKEFYKTSLGISLEDEQLREDVEKEILQIEAVENYRQFLVDVSGHMSSDVEEWGSGVADEKDITLLERDFQDYPVGLEPAVETQEEQLKPIILETAADYDGLERLLVDQLLTQEQCDSLIELATYGSEGDGYNNKHPHTSKEKFVGLHLLEAAKKSSFGELDSSLPWLYLNASRWSKNMVSQVFDLQQPLYFSYTHLVCRTAKDGVQDGRDDLSHPVHADNCIRYDNGECIKEPPAYTWRDYSALLYLNGAFEGGEFFYAHSAKDLSPDVLVKPRCGRLVGFSAGKENMHGVKAVTGGHRCAVALWFTLDPQHQEVAFDKAEQLLASL